MEQIKGTPLLSAHRAAGAKLVDFAGFKMPLSYSGIVDEHHAVRRALGVFDVSHMGEVDFRGAAAAAAVDRLVTNNVLSLDVGAALYTPICYPDGGIVDDCIVYRLAADHLRIVVNASNTAKDLAWFVENTDDACSVEDTSAQVALLAVQGPSAVPLLDELADGALARVPAFGLQRCEIAGVTVTAARTGYTGEDGFELFCAAERALALWEALFAAGEPRGLKPCGLGARDTLRLEARLPLYGNDIDQSTTPLEAGLRWTVKLKAGDFIGRQALLEQKRQGVPRKLVGMVMRSRGIARHGHQIHLPDDGDATFGPAVGRVTSGTKSPTLEQAIALGYVPRAQAKAGTSLVVDVRGKPVAAEVIKGPFYRRSY